MGLEVIDANICYGWKVLILCTWYSCFIRGESQLFSDTFCALLPNFHEQNSIQRTALLSLLRIFLSSKYILLECRIFLMQGCGSLMVWLRDSSLTERRWDVVAYKMFTPTSWFCSLSTVFSDSWTDRVVGAVWWQTGMLSWWCWSCWRSYQMLLSNADWGAIMQYLGRYNQCICLVLCS